MTPEVKVPLRSLVSGTAFRTLLTGRYGVVVKQCIAQAHCLVVFADEQDDAPPSGVHSDVMVELLPGGAAR